MDGCTKRRRPEAATEAVQPWIHRFELFGWPWFHERAFLPIFHDPFLFPYSLLLRDSDPVIETCGHAEC